MSSEVPSSSHSSTFTAPSKSLRPMSGATFLYLQEARCTHFFSLQRVIIDWLDRSYFLVGNRFLLSEINPTPFPFLDFTVHFLNLYLIVALHFLQIFSSL